MTLSGIGGRLKRWFSKRKGFNSTGRKMQLEFLRCVTSYMLKQDQTHKIYCSSRFCDIISVFNHLAMAQLYFLYTKLCGRHIRTDKSFFLKKRKDKHPHNTSLYNLFFRFSPNKASSDPQRAAEVSSPELHKNKTKSVFQRTFISFLIRWPLQWMNRFKSDSLCKQITLQTGITGIAKLS